MSQAFRFFSPQNSTRIVIGLKTVKIDFFQLAVEPIYHILYYYLPLHYILFKKSLKQFKEMPKNKTFPFCKKLPNRKISAIFIKTKRRYYLPLNFPLSSQLIKIIRQEILLIEKLL